MSIFSQIKPNEPVATLEGYFISMYGKSKVGKTSFIYELIKKHYKNDFSKALILATEIGYKTLRGVHAMDITGFADPEFEADNEEDQHLYGFGFIQAVDNLIAEKQTIPYRLIIIDTLTALQRYASAFVAEEQSIKDDKDYSNVGDIPWGGGYNLLQEVIYEQIDRLKKAGFGVLTISHDKTKTIEPKVGAKWDYTTLNLETKVADIVVREADINMYADLITKSNAKGNVDTERRLIIRSKGDIEVGSRFKTMPDELEFSAEAFLEAFDKAVLELYGGDEEAVSQKKMTEQDEQLSKRADNDHVADSHAETDDTKLEKEDESVDSEEYAIAARIETIKTLHRENFSSKEDKAVLAEIVTENLGMKNYTKSEDLEGLEKTITDLEAYLKDKD